MSEKGKNKIHHASDVCAQCGKIIDFLKSKKAVIFFLVILLLSSVVLALALLYRPKNVVRAESLDDVIATVSGENILRRDLNTAVYGLSFGGSVSSPAAVPDEVRKQLFNELIEYRVLQKKATELGISLTDKEISDKAISINQDYLKLTGVDKQVIEDDAKLELFRSKVKDKVITWSEGKVILVRFDLHYYDEPTGMSETDRQAQILKDKEYAGTLINGIYVDIKSGKITFDEGMQRANNDPVLGISAWKDYVMTWSQAFTKDDSIERGYPVSSKNFWDKISSTKVGQVSEPMIANVVLSEDSVVGKKGELVDGMYMIVSRTSGHDGDASDYQKWLIDTETTYKVTRNIYK